MSKTGFVYNKYEGQARRSLTFAERKVNLLGMKTTIQKEGIAMEGKLAKYGSMLAQNKGKKKEIVSKMAKIGADYYKKMFEFGMTTASNEMKVATPKTNEDLKGVFRLQAEAMIGKVYDDIQKRFKEKKVFASADGIVSQFLNGLKSIFIVQAMNLGRKAIMDNYKDEIYGLQYSAILDDRTTDLCKGLDGMIVKPGSRAEERFQPPNHWNCRSIWVEILNEEEFKPQFTPLSDAETDKKEISNKKNIIEVAKATKSLFE